MRNFGLDLFDALYKHWNFVYLIFILVKEPQAKLKKYAGLMKGLRLYRFTVKLDYYKAKILNLKRSDKNKLWDKYG